MPPKIRINGSDIIETAIRIVREKGMEAVNARSLAAKLNCSVKPLFREFNSMDELKTAVIKQAEKIYTQSMKTAFESSDGFYAMGSAYINFAKTDSNLFRLLFMTNIFNQGSAADIAGTTTGDDEVIALLSKKTGLDTKKAQELYTGIWFTIHGIASLLATNSCTLSDSEITQVLNDCFDGLAHSLQKR